MNVIKHLFLAGAIALGTACAGQSAPFEMPQVQQPSIPGRSVSLADFGGVGDGVTLNTEAFAAAIGRLSSQGGGTLEVPAGIWFTGPIGLKSHINLHLDKDAVIIFSTDQDLYPIIDTNFEGLDVRRCLSPIHAEGETDIAITGEGIIDGNGDAWREVKKRKVGDDLWKTIVKRGGVLSEDGKVWYPDEGYAKARATAGSLNYPDPSLDENEIKTFLRPVLLSFRNCERVLLEGVTFQNSPCWNLHPLWCRHLTVKDITVRNPHYSTNGDGIDIDACENVLVIGSSFDVGDDAICIKSGKDEDGRRHGIPCRNITIKDCTVYHGHGGVVIGSEMSGGVENMWVSGCRFLGTDVGLRFKSARGRGGLVRNIWFDHIYMKDIVAEAVTFNLYYEGVSSTEKAETSSAADASAKASLPAVDETTPEFRDFHFSDIVCAGAGQAIYVNGLPELPLAGVSFRDCRFTAQKGVEVHYAAPIIYENVFVNGEPL
jgi:polygalacturonase